MTKNELLFATAIFLIAAFFAGLLICSDIMEGKYSDANLNDSEEVNSDRDLVAYYNPATKTVIYRVQKEK